MKWPTSITLIRHEQSAYNELRGCKKNDALYQEFKAAFTVDHRSLKTRWLAEEVNKKFSLGVSDYETPLTPSGEICAFQTGQSIRLNHDHPLPNVVLVSPYVRTQQTYEHLRIGWPELRSIPVVYDDRIREQEHGLSLLYNDWRVFHVFHPEQKQLYDLMGPYWYQYPQGESVPQVRDRVRSIINTLIREYVGMHVFIITHHLTILSFRANFERLSAQEFVRLDEKKKSVNGGLTLYRGDPHRGGNGKLELVYYNRSI